MAMCEFTHTFNVAFEFCSEAEDGFVNYMMTSAYWYSHYDFLYAPS